MTHLLSEHDALTTSSASADHWPTDDNALLELLASEENFPGIGTMLQDLFTDDLVADGDTPA